MPDNKPKSKVTIVKKVSKPSTTLKPESRIDVSRSHQGPLTKYLGSDFKEYETNQRKLTFLGGDTPPEGVSKKVFEAHKAVRDKKRIK